MKLTKKIILAAAVLSLTGFVYAQDYEEEEPPIEPSLSIGGSAEVTGRSWTDLRDSNGERAKNVETKTEGNAALKLHFDYEGTSSLLNAKLKFDRTSLEKGNYKDIFDEFKATAIFGNWTFEAGKMRIVWGKTDKVHVLDNFNANDYSDFLIPDYNDRRIAEPMFRVMYATPFASNLKFEAVYTPVMTPDRLGTGVWTPKAAKTLTDNVTATAKGNYAATVTAAEEARKLAAEIAAASDAYKAAAQLHMADALSGSPTGAYKASFDASKKALTDVVTANAATLMKYGLNPTNEDTIASTLEDAAKGYLTDAVTAQNLALTNLSGLSNDSSFLYPDTNQLKYGQAGLRTTFIAGPLDLGFSYYYGHLKQPSFNALKFNTAMTKYVTTGNLSEEDKFLAYDKVQIFGLEGAFITPWWLLSLNSRFEFAYNMTEDTKGDDPFIHNNSLNWVVGFDRDIPVHNINLNIQTQGKYILKNDKIKDGIYKAYDVDNDPDDCYTNMKIIFDITDTWYYENIKLDLKGIYGIERKDFVFMPSLSVRTAGGNLIITGSGLVMWCKDEKSEFDGWNHNSFAQIGIKYNF